MEYLHQDSCAPYDVARTLRHYDVVDALLDAVASMNGFTASIEPDIPNNPAERNDLRVSVPPGSAIPPTDIDVSITSLVAARGRPYLMRVDMDNIPARNAPLAAVCPAIDKVIAVRVRKKLDRLPPLAGPPPADAPAWPGAPVHAPPFTPFILSAGGMLEESASRLLRAWGTRMTPFAAAHLRQAISIILLYGRVWCPPHGTTPLGAPPTRRHSVGRRPRSTSRAGEA